MGVQAPQVSVPGSQKPGWHCESFKHCTHLPLLGSFIAVAHRPCPLQSESCVQARHVLVVMSQTGVPPEQSMFVSHPTQVSVDGLQVGVAPVQGDLFVEVHCTQFPALGP